MPSIPTPMPRLVGSLVVIAGIFGYYPESAEAGLYGPSQRAALRWQMVTAEQGRLR